MNYRAMAVLIAAGLVTSCTLGPNYHRPAVQIPQNFRAPDPLAGPAGGVSRGPEVVGGF